MNSYLPLRGLLRAMAARWKPWLAAAIAAGLAVLLATLAALPQRDFVSANINFSYTGIESGLNPMGGRFDVNELKNAEVLSAAAADTGLGADQETLDALQDAITITGVVPRGTLDMITDYASSYSGKELSNTDTVELRRYYPSQFELTFRYADAGLTAAQGTRFLNAVLERYQAYFLDFYGYNSAFEQALREFDYSTYDYVDAVEVLERNLTGLASYLDWLSSQNQSRFVSQTSGLSFSDLVDAISTLRSENISVISSYINTNHLTKDMDSLLTFYAYRVERLGWTLESSQRQLETLDRRIAVYAKDQALVMTGGSGAESGSYTVSQPSETYNQLITSKVETQTQIAGIQESIAWYEREIERIGSQEETGTEQDAYAVLQNQFNVLDDRIVDILDKTRQTAMDYFVSDRYRQTFQVLETAAARPLPAQVIRRSLRPGVGVEAVIFGLYLLSSSAAVLWGRGASVPAEPKKKGGSRGRG